MHSLEQLRLDRRKTTRRYYLKHREQCLARTTAWAKNNVAKIRLISKRWRTNNPEQVKVLARKGKLKCEYGLSLNDYDEMLNAQSGQCAICKAYPTVSIKGHIPQLCVDHEHISGSVRGLLCPNCNKALGLMRDSVTNAAAMASYLIRYNGREALSCNMT